jgi:hypothetical protein
LSSGIPASAGECRSLAYDFAVGSVSLKGVVNRVFIG